MHKNTINVCLIGHVDAGKSTLNGRILLDLNLIDQRTIDKYKKESKLCNRESWYLSWIVDHGNERLKGKTQEMCTTFISLPKVNININDTPGHKLYLSDMIRGTNQSDFAILIVSAKKGEFESGFVKSGQTKEHVILSKSGNIKELIVVVNKMDMVGYDRSKFFFIVNELNCFLRRVYERVVYVPVSGYYGVNVMKESERKYFVGESEKEILNQKEGDNQKESDNQDKDMINNTNLNSHPTTPTSNFSWYTGPSLLQILNNLKLKNTHNSNLYTILEQVNKNTLLIKIESGKVKNNSLILILPKKSKNKIVSVYDDEENEIERGCVGEIVRVRVCSEEEYEVGDMIVDYTEDKEDYTGDKEDYKGFNKNLNKDLKNLTLNKNLNLKITKSFTCTLSILNTKHIITPGYKCLLHYKLKTKTVKIIALQKKLNDKVIKIKYCGVNEKVRAKIEIEDWMVMRVGEWFAVRDEDVTVGVGCVRKVF